KIESHTGKSMRRTLDDVTELARTKNPVASSGLLKERASAQLQLGRAEAILRSGRLSLLDIALYQRLRALDHDEMRSEDLTPVREFFRGPRPRLEPARRCMEHCALGPDSSRAHHASSF